jgi:hypothetical protein
MSWWFCCANREGKVEGAWRKKQMGELSGKS